MTIRKDKKFYIILTITLAFMFGFGFLPPIGQITKEGMQLLGIFLGMIFAWIFGEITWSAVLGLLAVTFMDFGGIGANWSSLVGNPNVALVLVAMIIVYTMESNGMMGEFARYVVSTEWARKSPWSLVAAFFLADFVLSMFISTGLAVILILWALFYEVCKEVGLKPHDQFATVVLIGIVIVSACASVIMPYSPTVLACFSIERAITPDLIVGNLTYIVFNFIVAAIASFLIFLVCRFVLRPPIDFKLAKKESYKMNLTPRRKACIVYLLLLVALMLIPPLLPAENIIRVIFGNKLGTLGCLILISILMAVTHIDGQPLLDLEMGLKEGVQWQLFLLTSAAFLVSGYLTVPEYGVISTLTAVIAPIFEGKSAVFILVFAIGALVLMTNLINDIVSISILYPLCVPFYVSAGGSAELLAVLMIAAMIQGCFMPSGSILGALLHGNHEWLSAKENYYYIGIMEIIILIVLCGAGFVGFNLGIFT